MAADDFDKLLREVEAALGPTGGGKARPVEPARAAAPEPEAGMSARLRSAVPRGAVVGAGCAVVVGGLFSILPFVDGLSGALAAFGTGFVVSVSGRLRRRR